MKRIFLSFAFAGIVGASSAASLLTLSKTINPSTVQQDDKTKKECKKECSKDAKGKKECCKSKTSPATPAK